MQCIVLINGDSSADLLFFGLDVTQSHVYTNFDFDQLMIFD